MLSELEKAIGYTFKRKELLEQALVHSSYANEHKNTHPDYNERLEFLGDAVLELSSSRYLYDAFPREPEGNLSKRRSAAVCEASLAVCARKIRLGEYLFLGRGEELGGGRGRDSLLSDAFEAVIGAMYLDGGFAPADRFVTEHVMREMSVSPAYEDAKTELQEIIQSRGAGDIVYAVTEESGPEHDKRFTVSLSIGEKSVSTGTGKSKKSAEQAAAAAALALYGKKTTGKE